MRKVIAIVFVVAALCVCGSLVADAQTKERVKVEGAAPMWGRMVDLSHAYMKDHPKCEIIVSRNSMADEGMQAFIAGKAEVVMASRRITDQERESAKARGIQVDENMIGYGGIVVITDQKNPLSELSVEQVKKVFTGEITNWKDMGGKDQPVIVFRKLGKKFPGTMLFVENDILGGVPIVKTAQPIADFPTILKKVSQTPGSIAYTRIRDTFESQAGHAAKIKPLKIRKDDASPPVAPSRATVKDGTYPLRRPYYLYTSAPEGTEAHGFVDFVVSKGWQNKNLTYMWQ